MIRAGKRQDPGRARTVNDFNTYHIVVAKMPRKQKYQIIQRVYWGGQISGTVPHGFGFEIHTVPKITQKHLQLPLVRNWSNSALRKTIPPPEDDLV